MVRKTKENAELTRQGIINAARTVFLTRGVSKSTLEHIAAQAQVTRGAVYWHFKNKAEIFHAIRDQVFLPLIDRIDDTLIVANNDDALTQIEKSLCDTVHELNTNIEMRQTYEIMMMKCEYVDDFSTVLQQILDNCASITGKFEHAYERAKEQNILSGTYTPRALALDTHLFFSGLLHMWIKDADGSKFRFQATELIQLHIKLRRK
ncbi:MAG: TetR family transcriptional regulator [Methylotenera sp.]|nr:TetR family transcriptional regulator [Methylotenera sp.]